MESIIERMRTRPVIFDGAMGTMIYGMGVFINSCYDELSIVNPTLISRIHREYRDAGADVLETNTFGANRVKLRAFGMGERVDEINRAAVALAREAAGEGLWVAGAVGPCLHPHEAFDESLSPQYREAFREQCRSLAGAGVDFIHLETFSHLAEIEIAAAAGKETGLPVSASFSVNEEGVASDGNAIEDFSRALCVDSNVDIMGINCGMGPSGLLQALERMIHLCEKPIVVMPNAGYPQDVGGRTMYLTSPDYFATYARRFIQLGARGVGGCCGTTPEHIAKAVSMIKNLGELRPYRTIREVKELPENVTPVPMEKKSRFAEKLARGIHVSTVEVVPPRSIDLSGMLERVAWCHERNVDAVNIPDGPRASARISNLVAAVRIQDRVGIEAIPHFCCRDRNLMAMQGDLMGGYASGLKNFLLVTGDPPKIGDYPEMTGVFDVDAIGLTAMVRNLNHGYDLAGHTIGAPTGILIGVAANPCAVDLTREVERFFRKIDAGAEYAITQPVFDPDALFRFIDMASTHGRTIPIVAGVWPLSSYRNALFMATEVPGVVVPPLILERMERCTSAEESRKAGIEIALEMKSKIASSVQGFQVSAPMGNVETALQVLELV
ncbi:MAG: bifunctional homocysteine S-methyltransferase/methylenetetrahydrofolate reductase [Spirochaetes bacterium]|nr:bifunctional homocysteine S-methyltransferase/methylenetetrahydrofolate reductase [Spirochaetota bacterium]